MQPWRKLTFWSFLCLPKQWSPLVFLKGPGLGWLFGLLLVQALAQMFCPFHTPLPALPRLFPVGLGLYFFFIFFFCICPCQSMWVDIQDLKTQGAFRAINSIQTPGVLPRRCLPLQTSTRPAGGQARAAVTTHRVREAASHSLDCRGASQVQATWNWGSQAALLGPEAFSSQTQSEASRVPAWVSSEPGHPFFVEAGGGPAREP